MMVVAKENTFQVVSLHLSIIRIFYVYLEIYSECTCLNPTALGGYNTQNKATGGLTGLRLTAGV